MTRTPLKDEFLILMRFYPVKITGKKSQEKSPEADRASMLDFSVSARKPKAVSNSKKMAPRENLFHLQISWCLLTLRNLHINSSYINICCYLSDNKRES